MSYLFQETISDKYVNIVCDTIISMITSRVYHQHHLHTEFAPISWQLPNTHNVLFNRNFILAFLINIYGEFDTSVYIPKWD